MNEEDFNVLKIKADELIGSGVYIECEKGNGEKEIVQCKFVSYKTGKRTYPDKTASQYFPKAILKVKDTEKEISRFHLEKVVQAIKKNNTLTNGCI